MCIRVQATHVASATNLCHPGRWLGSMSRPASRARGMSVMCATSYIQVDPILKQHKRVSHGPDAPEPDEAFFCPHCNRVQGEEDHA